MEKNMESIIMVLCMDKGLGLYRDFTITPRKESHMENEMESGLI